MSPPEHETSILKQDKMQRSELEQAVRDGPRRKRLFKERKDTILRKSYEICGPGVEVLSIVRDGDTWYCYRSPGWIQDRVPIVCCLLC